MRYDISKPTAPKMPHLGKGTECVKIGSSDKCVVFVPKRWTEMKIAKILSLPLVTPN